MTVCVYVGKKKKAPVPVWGRGRKFGFVQRARGGPRRGLFRKAIPVNIKSVLLDHYGFVDREIRLLFCQEIEPGLQNGLVKVHGPGLQTQEGLVLLGQVEEG